MRKVFAICLVCLIPTAWLFAAGYQIGEHGAKAQGMGSAFVAQASDPSAIFFNAAGLGFHSGVGIMGGATLIAPRTDFTGPTPSTATTKMVSQNFFPPHAYVTYGMENGLAFGVGLFVPYGLGTEWEETWVGRYEAVKTDLQAMYINPTIAYRVSPKLAVGAGFNYILGNVTLSQKVNLPPSMGGPLPVDWDSKLEGDGTAFTFNAGLLFKATEKLSLGLSYRHLAEIEFEGDATFENVPSAVAPFFPNQTGKTTLPMPGDVKVGAAYAVQENLIVEADLEYVLWSSYDKLTLKFDKGVAGQTELTSEKDYKNSILVRLGGEYTVDKLSLRAGFVYDQTPVPDKTLEPLLPDANRLEVSFGIGFKVTKNVTIDAAYQLIKASERTVEPSVNKFPGTYNNTANLVGVSLNLGF